LKNTNYTEWITQEVQKFTKSSANNMQKWNDEPAWGTPIIGFSNGSDPLYQFYKQDIGEFYCSPLEFLHHQYTTKHFDAHHITVVSWILPQTEATKRDHRQETHFPSERWARSRIFGEDFNNDLRRHMSQIRVCFHMV
jgi:epoxyqueuosine reductase